MKIINMLVPESKYGIKCPYTMKPEYIVVHNTYNDAPARNEISYMSTNNNQTSFHYAVDDIEVVQGIREDRNAWHASDGASGAGNRKGIAIEICYSKSGGERFDKAEKNAVPLIAELMNKYGIDIDHVKRHYDFATDHKYCPHRTMDNGWDRFLNMIRSELGQSAPTHQPEQPQPSTGTKYPVGTPVCVQQLNTQSNGGNLVNAHNEGVIGRVIPGAQYPYRVDRNGTAIGWVNDAIIDGDSHTPGGSAPNKPSAGTKYVVGTPICTCILATSSTGGKVYQGDWDGTITRVIPGAPYPYLIDNGNIGWTNDTGIDSDQHTPQ